MLFWPHVKALLLAHNLPVQAWSSHLLASGSRDRSVLLRDVRAKEAAVGKLAAHRSEVCGLKVSACAVSRQQLVGQGLCSKQAAGS